MTNPTPQQSAILQTAAKGKDLMVVARAGTGKTTTLVLLADVLRQGGLALAFNVKIKKEMSERLPKHFEALTMNGLGHRAWSAGRGSLFIDAGKTYKVIDEYLQTSKLTATYEEKQALKKLVDWCKSAGLVPKNCTFQGRGLIPDSQDSWVRAFDFIEEDFKEDHVILAREILNLSIRKAYERNLDFNDQIYMPTLFGGAFPNPKVLLVDEVQDLSPINHKMLKLCRAGQYVFVGDPMQAIYAFRGAMTDSMDQLHKILPEGRELVSLPLTVTFRCGKTIVERAKALVPDYLAAPNNPQGQILRWPSSDKQASAHWSPSDVPDGAAILCRNNAPLISCALKFLRARRPVVILGREFAERIKKDLKKACPQDSTPVSEVIIRMETFYNAKLKAKPTQTQLDQITDRLAAFKALAEDEETKTLADLIDKLDEIFSDERGLITLSTGHKAKGLEWDWVMHLNPHLIPARWASNPESLQQEYNIQYVIETRPRHTLVLAKIEDLQL